MVFDRDRLLSKVMQPRAWRFVPPLFLTFLVLALTILVLNRAATKPFWFDEIFTLNLAQYPAGAGLWRALTRGFDFNPPAIYVATHASEQLFGRGPIASRLPSILSGIVALLCLIRVSSRAGGKSAGFWALLLFSASGMVGFLYEARPYALMLAGAMVAWVCWQSRVESERFAALKLSGLAAGLSLALASHIWAVVIPGCFLVSAVYRWRRTGQPDLPALAAMLVPYTIALSYVPLWLASRRIHFGGKHSMSTSFTGAYGGVLNLMPLVWIGCAGALLAARILLPRAERPDPASPAPREDLILAACLCLSPLVVFAVTRLPNTPFVSRHILPSALGFTFLFAQSLAVLGRRAKWTAYILILALGTAVSAHTLRVTARGWSMPDPADPDLAMVSAQDSSDEPVVYANGLRFLAADFYASPAQAKRLIYVADPAFAHHYTGADSVDAALLAGRSYLNVRGRVLSYDDLRRAYPHFWLIDDHGEWNWLGRKLRAGGASILPAGSAQPHIFRVLVR